MPDILAKFTRSNGSPPKRGAKRAIVHAGLPKTGTSSVQNATFNHREALLQRNRLLCPSVTACHNIQVHTMFSEKAGQYVLNKRDGFTEPEDLAKRAESFHSIYAKELSLDNWDTLFFSAEAISNLSEPGLLQMRDWLHSFVEDIAVIFVAREPVSFCVSSMQQRLKLGVTLDKLYKQPPLPRFQLAIEKLWSVFGREAVEIVCFEDLIRHENSIVGWFCDRLEVDSETATGICAAPAVNESLSLEAAHLLSEVNRINGGRGRSKDNQIDVGPNLLQTLKGRKFTVPLDVRRDIHQRSREDVAWLDRECGITRYSGEFSSGTAKNDPEEMPNDEFIASLARMIIRIQRAAKIKASHASANPPKPSARPIPPDAAP